MTAAPGAIALSVNLNKIALIRNSRDGNYPNVAEFGRLCLATGAQGLTVHPRPDQRHIRASDVPELAAVTKEFSGAEYNIEGNPFAGPQGSYPGLMSLVESVRPTQCTLVPDSNAQLTSDHGFNLFDSGDRLRPILETLRSWGVRVSLFMDPDLEQIRLAKEIGADRIELYTGPYALAYTQSPDQAQDLYQTYFAAAQYAGEIGLDVNAGHDLNLDNMQEFRHIPNLREVSIGHALTVDALKMGFVSAVKSYLALCR